MCSPPSLYLSVPLISLSLSLTVNNPPNHRNNNHMVMSGAPVANSRADWAAREFHANRLAMQRNRARAEALERGLDPDYIDDTPLISDPEHGEGLDSDPTRVLGRLGHGHGGKGNGNGRADDMATRVHRPAQANSHARDDPDYGHGANNPKDKEAIYLEALAKERREYQARVREAKNRANDNGNVGGRRGGGGGGLARTGVIRKPSPSSPPRSPGDELASLDSDPSVSGSPDRTRALSSSSSPSSQNQKSSKASSPDNLKNKEDEYKALLARERQEYQERLKKIRANQQNQQKSVNDRGGGGDDEGGRGQEEEELQVEHGSSQAQVK